MMFESSDEAILCKFFLTTFVGSALILFCQLPEKSISSFEAFCALFMNKYGSHRKHMKVMQVLHKMD